MVKIFVDCASPLGRGHTLTEDMVVNRVPSVGEVIFFRRMDVEFKMKVVKVMHYPLTDDELAGGYAASDLMNRCWAYVACEVA